MPNTATSTPGWHQLYESALLETDTQKLTELVFRIEAALILREQEVGNSPIYADERNVMAKASEALLVIKTEKLKVATD